MVVAGPTKHRTNDTSSCHEPQTSEDESGIIIFICLIVIQLLIKLHFGDQVLKEKGFLFGCIFAGCDKLVFFLIIFSCSHFCLTKPLFSVSGIPPTNPQNKWISVNSSFAGENSIPTSGGLSLVQSVYQVTNIPIDLNYHHYQSLIDQMFSILCENYIFTSIFFKKNLKIIFLKVKETELLGISLKTAQFTFTFDDELFIPIAGACPYFVCNNGRRNQQV